MPAKRRGPKKGGVGGKRAALASAAGAPGRPAASENADGPALIFEDPFGDDIDAEDEAILAMDEEARRASLEAASREADEEPEGESKVMEDLRRVQELEAAEDALEAAPRQLWVPGMSLGEGEELVMDTSAYVMYHALRPEWPALSFDVLRDGLGDRRSRFPHTAYLALGSQAARAADNKISVIKLSDMHRLQQADDSDAEDDDDHLEEDPVLETRQIRHRGGVNRLRSMPQAPHVLATFADTGSVHVYDALHALRSLDERGVPAQEQRPTYSFSGHKDEGYALGWSPAAQGLLASGDNRHAIHVHLPRDGGAAWSASSAMKGHSKAVEDIQWSPSEDTVFASCGCDGTVRVWDTRNAKGPMLTATTHPGTDVNVISWNANMAYLLASGADDGGLKIWDLRHIQAEAKPIAHYTYHEQPITSVEWHPTDESVLAVSSDDDQLSIWDLSVEEDAEAMETMNAQPMAADLQRLPPQLLFVHQGQHAIKELHFHPQIPGAIVSTAQDSLNVFKPATTI